MGSEYKLEHKPLVSVIIPTYNSEKTLERCLQSIRRQTYKNIEIIVIDGGSNDRTIEIAKRYKANVYILPNSSMADATNFGAKKSHGKYIYRVDSDVILDKTLIEKAVYKCEREGYDGVCIFWIPDETISFWAKIRKIEKISYIKYPTQVGSVKYNKPVLGARFLRRDVFFGIGMMDENAPIAGEDYALYNKLAQSRYKFAVIDATELHIGEPMTLLDVFRKYLRYGCTLKRALATKSLRVRQFSPFGRRYYLDAFKLALNEGLLFFIGLIVYEITVYVSTLLGLIYCIVRGGVNKK